MPEGSRLIVAVFLVLALVAEAGAIDLFGRGGEDESEWAEAPPRPEPRDIRRLEIHEDVVERLEEKTGASPEFLRGPGEKPIGLAWPVDSTRGDELVRAERELFTQSGYAIFLAERNFGMKPDRIGVIPATDPFAPVIALGTSGSPDPSNDKVVARLREWRQETGLDLVGAGTDWVEVELSRLPSDLDAFLGEVRSLAPDTVSRAPESAKRLADGIRRTRRVLLWWKEP